MARCSTKGSSNAEMHKAIGYHSSELKKAKDPAMKKHHADALSKLAGMAGGTGSAQAPKSRGRKPKTTTIPSKGSGRKPKAASGTGDDMGGMDM